MFLPFAGDMAIGEYILQAIKQSSTKRLSYGELKKIVDTSDPTLSKYLKWLVEEGVLLREKKWRAVWYSESKKERIQEYIRQHRFDKTPIVYIADFLRAYTPNETLRLKPWYTILDKALESHQTLSTWDYKKNVRSIENMLIDLSYSSSFLEWNTYSYFDTEILIKYNEKAPNHNSEEAQMILNHKDAIQYLFDAKSDLFSKKIFCDIHSLLWKDLLHEGDLGVFRSNEVRIGWSRYRPLGSKVELEAEFHCFLEKLNTIENPFEKSLFILVFIPYFQLFLDINKRTSRISCNLPLIQHGLPILSLLEVTQREYITAILAVYELNDPSLLAELYATNYVQTIERYL